MRPRGRFRRTPRISARCRAAVKPGTTKLVWLETPSNPLWGVSDIAAAAGIAHAAGAALAVDFDLRDADLHPAARARRRRRHAFGDQISQRPFRRRRRRARLCARRRALRARAARHPQGARPHPAPVRGVPADRAACARSTCACAPRPPTRWSSRAASPITPPSPTCSIPACRIIPATRSPGGRCRAASAACCRSACAAAREAAIATAARVNLWKRATSLGGVELLIEHRASIEGAGLALSARPAAAVGRNRGRRGPLAGHRPGARRVGPARKFAAPGPHCCRKQPSVTRAHSKSVQKRRG